MSQSRTKNATINKSARRKIEYNEKQVDMSKLQNNYGVNAKSNALLEERKN